MRTGNRKMGLRAYEMGGFLGCCEQVRMCTAPLVTVLGCSYLHNFSAPQNYIIHVKSAKKIWDYLLFLCIASFINPSGYKGLHIPTL